MPTLTVNATITYGSTVPDGSVPCREPLFYTLNYTESSIKIVQIAASTTDFLVSLDTIGAPRFVFVQAVETDVTVKLSDGVNDVATTLAQAGGWVMLANPNGQPVNQLLVTTPASPVTGARVRVLSFE
jgi:hypothetical protein